MTEPKLLTKGIRESGGIRLSVLFGLFFITLVITSIITQALQLTTGLSQREILLISATVQCFLVFIIPSFITSRFCSKEPLRWLSLTQKMDWRPFMGVIIVYCLFLPAMNWLILWNSEMHFPQSMQGVENLFRQWEDSGEESTKILLENHGAGEIIAGILIIGVLTGFSEELFFRGALQKIFYQTSLGRSLAIWATAFIFSAIHFQFFGFIPRLLMGAFFGYLVAWTGSLWPAVFAHAFNNSLTVIIGSFDGGEAVTTYIENVGITDGGFPTIALASALLTLIFIFYFKNIFFRKA